VLDSAARGGSASKAVRDGMREYFVLRDGLDSAAVTRSGTQSSAAPEESQLQSDLFHPIVRA